MSKRIEKKFIKYVAKQTPHSEGKEESEEVKKDEVPIIIIICLN